jgi:hypothetical protein
MGQEKNKPAIVRNKLDKDWIKISIILKVFCT